MSQPFFDINDTVYAQRNFVVAGEAVDPQVVRVKYMDPSSNVTGWLVYGTSVLVEKVADGQYRIAIAVDEAGTWKCRWESSGTFPSAVEDQFYVRSSSF